MALTNKYIAHLILPRIKLISIFKNLISFFYYYYNYKFNKKNEIKHI